MYLHVYIPTAKQTRSTDLRVLTTNESLSFYIANYFRIAVPRIESERPIAINLLNN